MGLIEDARAARNAGLTYGQYMTKKEFVPPKKEEGPTCIICGFPLVGKQVYYCSDRCRYRMKQRRKYGDVLV